MFDYKNKALRNDLFVCFNVCEISVLSCFLFIVVVAVVVVGFI